MQVVTIGRKIRPMIRAFLSGAILATGAAATASPPPDVEQLAPPTEGPEEIQQVGEPVPVDPASPAQISTTGQGGRETPQLSPEDRAVPSPAQISRGSRTAQAPAPLSAPGDGRTGSMTPVEGEDRCDTERRDGGTDAVCARVIETRSAEFERPDPATLSPEQRLLVEQQLTEEADAARRLTTPAMDPDSLDQQSIAAIALRRNQKREEIVEEPKPEAAAAVLNLIPGIPQSSTPD